jgi:dolichyl-phosphate beta-glucosyltransferase
MPSNKPSNTRPDLTIIIPALNEEKRIGKTLDQLATYLKTEKTLRDKTIEVVVVAADSPDKTKEVVVSKKNKFTNLSLLKPGPRVGKGRDVQYGVMRAKGKAVIFMDADLATPLKYLPKFYKAYEEGADVVIATRNLRRHHPNFLRRLVSNAGNLAFKFAGGVWVEDSQCGFKLFTREASRLCFSKLTILGWGFDMEILAISKANNLKITSFRVNDWTSVSGGTFDASILKNSIVSLKDLMHILSRRLSGYYKN